MGVASESLGEHLMCRIPQNVWLKTYFPLLICIWTVPVYAKPVTATGCSKAAVTAAYNSAADGDTIVIPAGNCDSSNQWSSPLVVSKKVTVQGAGTGQTIIGLSTGTNVFRINADNVRITGISFDANNYVTTNRGLIMAGYNGTESCAGSNAYKDFRIDHNSFTGLYSGDPSGCLGCNSIVVRGDVYGVIDHNTFTNCAGECIDVQNAGYLKHALSNEPGQYSANHTVYIEDNTFTYNQTYSGENVVDGNSGARYVFRYNTISLSGSGSINGIVSSHDCSGGDVCDNATQAESNIQLVEMYGNIIYNSANTSGGGGVARWMNWRGGHFYIYNNTIYYNNMDSGVQAYHLRAGHRPGCSSLEFRGFSEFCHEGTGAEGLTRNKTTLNGAIGNDTSCPVMASVSGFPTYGGSIIIGTEQIDYTGISGNQLTPCTRGANRDGGAGARASHADASAVHLLNFGVCGDQQQESYLWGNLYKATLQSSGVGMNSVVVDWQTSNLPNYERYDIKSYAERPQNWQYRNDGTAYSYAAYPYPHPLTAGIAAPSNLRIVP